MRRVILVIAGLSGALAVALGAAAAHGLGSLLTPDNVARVETGARYQLVQAVALIALGLADRPWLDRIARVAIGALAFGTVVFPGALHGLAFSEWRPLAQVAPLGGLGLILGWLGLAVYGWRSYQDR